MTNFNNTTYESILYDSIHDAFYSNSSNSGKIRSIRRIAEVIVRRILLIPEGEQMTLGCGRVNQRLPEINNTILPNAVEIIRTKGNSATHTHDISEKTEEDVEKTKDALLDLLSYLFIQFFEQYTFGTNPKILSAFSLIPPIVRYKTLTYLYEKNPENVYVIDKLSLATFKAKGIDEAISFLNSNKEQLESIPYNNYRLFPNMFESCKDKVNRLYEAKSAGKIISYEDFEEAKPYYEEFKLKNPSSQDEIEFSAIMEFLYLGRKEKT
jgi:hypothetical protein